VWWLRGKISRLPNSGTALKWVGQLHKADVLLPGRKWRDHILQRMSAKSEVESLEFTGVPTT